MRSKQLGASASSPARFGRSSDFSSARRNLRQGLSRQNPNETAPPSGNRQPLQQQRQSAGGGRDWDLSLTFRLATDISRAAANHHRIRARAGDAARRPELLRRSVSIPVQPRRRSPTTRSGLRCAALHDLRERLSPSVDRKRRSSLCSEDRADIPPPHDDPGLRVVLLPLSARQHRGGRESASLTGGETSWTRALIARCGAPSEETAWRRRQSGFASWIAPEWRTTADPSQKTRPHETRSAKRHHSRRTEKPTPRTVGK